MRLSGIATVAALTAAAALMVSCSDDTKQAALDSRLTDGAASSGPRVFATFNVALAEGAVPYATERRPLIVDALKQLKADVLCLEEAWFDEDAQAIIDGVKSTFPYSFREKTEDTSAPTVRCADVAAVAALKTCSDEKCTPNGISVFACVTGPCKAQYDPLTDECKLCLGANTTNPASCALGGAKDFVYGGRNGLLLLSRFELKNAKYTPYDTVVFKRGVITADVGSVQVQCTHTPSDLGMLPYPKTAKYGSWSGENAAAITALAGTATGGCVVLEGDLNAGPAQDGLTGELADNFKAYAANGYAEPWTTPQCTWCKDNPLAASTVDEWIDHVMFKGSCAAGSYSRILDGAVTLTSEGKTVTTRLSDHYGLSAELK